MSKYIILLIIAASVTLYACSNKKNDGGRTTVMVSIEPQKWILERIVGDRIDVKVFFKGSTDPENFDPPISVLKDAAKTTLFFKTGHLQWEDVLIDKLKGGNKLKIVDTSVGIKPITGTHSHDRVSQSDDVDPHVWTSLRNAKVIAKNMYKEIVALDPENKTYYKSNFDELNEKLDSMDWNFGKVIKNSSIEDFVVFHPSLSYFARDYGLSQIALGSEGKEISITSLQKKLNEIKENGVEILFYQTGGEEEQFKSLLSDDKLKKIEINTMSYDWENEMNKVMNAFTR